MTLTPRLAITLLADSQVQPEEPTNEAVAILELFATRCIVKSRATAGQPVSPANGDSYLLTATPTGTNWSGQANKLAHYLNGAWIFRAPVEGFAIEVEDEDAPFVYRGGNWVANGTNIRPVAFFFTTTPTSSEVLLLYTACEAITFADNFAGSVADLGINPTTSFVLDVQVNGVSVGSITISTGGVFTFNTTAGALVLANGDQLKVVAPSTADASVANVSITLKGTI